MEKEYIFALLIDTENVSPKYYDIITNELEEIGSIKIKRAYGDFASNNAWTDKAIAEGIMPIQAFAQTKGKNSTDLVMTIDAMDLFYSKEVDAFCIATSDSDFARLAQRLKEGGMYIVTAGEKKTPVPLSKSSNKFIMLDELFKAQTQTKPKKESVARAPKPESAENVTAPEVEDLKNVVKDILDSNMDGEGWTQFSAVVTQLEKKYPQFSYKTYGVKSKKEFFEKMLGCTFKKEGTVVSVMLK